MATVIPQTKVLELPHDLTDKEKLDYQDKIMKLLTTEEDLEDELEAAQAEFKSTKASVEKRTKDVKAEIRKVRGEIKVGREMRKHLCDVHRNIEKQEVEYALHSGPEMGKIIKTEPFTPDDWAAIQEQQANQLDLPFDEADTTTEQLDLRSQADLTAPSELHPNIDEMGNYIAGPDTDAYNLANPGDTTYQHLSQSIDFAPQVTSVQAADAGAEQTDAADVDRDDEHDLGTPHTEGDDDEGDDEPSEDDEPGDEPTPTPKVPKRPAKKRKPSAE